MANSIKIKSIPAEETLPIRQKILREGKALELCSFSGDNELSTIHLGAFFEQKLIGIISLIKNSNLIFKNERNQFQLRGMAVLSEFQNQNVGAELLKKAEKKLRKGKPTFLWCNAREKAVGFYQKYGYSIWGNKFEISEIGPHFIMYKQL